MKKGFTLIELLIVIAVLGILAAGVLATIDPFEQFKKARDSNARNSVVETYNAFVRFNANHGDWPWENAASTANCAVMSGSMTTNPGQGCLTALVNDGELKAGFPGSVTSGVATSAYFNYLSSENNIAVCFLPQSKAVRSDANSTYTQLGEAGPVECPSATVQTCYWCAK